MTAELTRRHAEHAIDIDAPAAQIYTLIADVTNWPRIFPPTLHVERISKSDHEELIEIWATAVDDVKNWTSRRVLDAANTRIDFRQERSQSPIASMGGSWIIESLPNGSSRVRLLHDYTADDTSALAWIDEAVDTNSRAELASLKFNIERDVLAASRTITFVDTVRIRGSVDDVFDFVNDAHLWPDRLPHVVTVRLGEPTPGVQSLEMDTRSPDGSTHTTKSLRVVVPRSKIAYKQSTLPALMELHTGVWLFEQEADEVVVSSQHTAVIRAQAIEDVLGVGTDIETAKQYVHHALSTNSLATLAHAKAHAEGDR